MKNSERNILALCSMLLFLSGFVYYVEFYSVLPALLLAVILTFQFTMLGIAVCYMIWRSHSVTSLRSGIIIIGVSVFFTVTRYLVVLLTLQYHLPEDTVFHNPNRSLSFLLISNLLVAVTSFFYARYRQVKKENSILEAKLSKYSKYQNKEAPVLTFKYDGEEKKLDCNLILFLNSEREYTKINVVSNSFLVLDRLKNFEKRLPRSRFLRTHRSFIVNVSKIERFDDDFVYVSSHCIPIGRSYKRYVASILGHD